MLRGPFLAESGCNGNIRKVLLSDSLSLSETGSLCSCPGTHYDQADLELTKIHLDKRCVPPCLASRKSMSNQAAVLKEQADELGLK